MDQPAGGAFVPQDLAAAAVVMRFARRDRELQCCGVHIALHEQLAAVGVGRNDGDQAAVVKFGSEVVAFFDLFDRVAGLKSDWRDRHFGSLVVFFCGPEEYRA